ncbi:DF family (seleno)protein [Nocardioides pyridinolyticus]
MKVELLYFDGCPNWTVADERLAEALRVVSLDDVTVHRRKVETEQNAIAVRFTGSPTVLVDGRDPFATGDEQVGLACRVYATPQGLAGSPSLAQLVEALS